MDETWLDPHVPVDLDNCAREPIHIPGSIQPRGVLLVLDDDHTVVQASASTAAHLGIDAADALGRPLADVVGTEAAEVIAAHLRAGGDVRDRNPVLVDVQGVPTDAVLHHPPGAEHLLVVELEAAAGPRPLEHTNTYQAVRGTVGALNRASSLEELYAVTAREVRALTGFDRVMIYRFDADYNGEVVGEDRRADLNSFFGLHYPATDIPPQARALYERNWIRLISDVEYVPSPIVVADPQRSAPLDLTFATLRSVSPMHIEYLQNMGVTASMSISLLKDGRLWGLIACHHYSGPWAPPYGVRAAAEFLGSVLSLRLVAQVEEDRIAAARRVGAELAGLVAASRAEDVPLAEALTGDDTLLTLMAADGAIVRAHGEVATVGCAPPGAGALLEWAVSQGSEVVCTTSLAQDAPGLAAAVPEVAGLLAVTLPSDDAVVWLRREAVYDVDWGGDPRNKEIARGEGEEVRLSPRKSFDRWRETVRGSSLPWTEEQAEIAALLRGHVVEALYLRGRRDARAAEVLQRSALPAQLPEVPGWSFEARYSPADGNRVGGDWYDALELPDGRLAVAVGDVTGHGLAAASTMGKLRNGLRALLVSGAAQQLVATAVRGLDDVMRVTMPDEMATLLLAVVDPATGEAEYARVGHLPLIVLAADGEASWAGPVGVAPLGYVAGTPETGRLTVPPGGGLVLFTDGLIERRETPLVESLSTLRDAFSGGAPLDAVIAAVRDPRSTDDATAVVVRRG
ncbi:SpoIIE family protein phosphatase [Georgenia faecalis]|uniref:SpoIIE family protein phosphatase n=1 Tax=Georgenia faecalis TaxID=2483799 RepID=A0ABV9D928_9MICO|nr:SpoIIE family protein phosphatase [Georgenia faecalis]